MLAAADALDAAEAAATTPTRVHAGGGAAPPARRSSSPTSRTRSAERLFDAGGASATSRERNLDRHWRNARTLASHNPAMYKARALGDLRINGERLPANGFF